MEVALYFSSYSPLFALLALRFEPTGLVWVCGVVAFLGFFGGPLVFRRYRSVTPRVWELKSVEDRGHEVSGYLATYLIPFVAAQNPGPRQIIGYALFLTLAGIIYVRSGLIQINPSLYVFGWRIAGVKIGEGWSGFVFTKQRLPTSASLPLVRLSERVFIDFGREQRDDSPDRSR